MGRLTLDCDIDSSCGTPGTRQGRSTWIPVQEGAAPASRSLLPLSLLTPHLFFPSSSSKFEKSSISSPFSVAFAPSGPPALQFHCLQSVSASSAAAHSLPFQIEVPELPATRPGLSPGVYRVPPWDSSRSWYYHRAQKPLFGTLVCCVLTGSEFACTAPCRPPFTSIGALCAGLQLFLACQRVAACPQPHNPILSSLIACSRYHLLSSAIVLSKIRPPTRSRSCLLICARFPSPRRRYCRRELAEAV